MKPIPKAWQIAGAIALLAVALAPYAYYVGMGADMRDQPYQIMMGFTPWRENPLTPLFAIFTSWIGTLLGSEMITMRYVSCALMVLSVGAAALYGARGNWVKGLTAASIVIIIAPFVTTQSLSYSYNVWGYFFFTVILLALLQWLKEGSQRRWLWPTVMAVATVCAILVRLPNCVAMPCVAVTMWLGPSQRRHCALWAIFYVMVTLALWLAFLLIGYGSMAMYMAYVRDFSVANHPIGNLFFVMRIGLPLLLPFILGFLGLWCILAAIARRVSRPLMRWICYALVAGVFLLAGYHYIDGFTDYYLVSALVVVGAVTVMALCHERYERLGALAVLGFLLVAGVGSNVWIMNYMMLPGLPLLYFWLKPRLPRRTLTVFIVFVFLAVVRVGFVGIRHYYTPNDVNALQATATITHTRMQGIRSTPERVTEIENIWQQVNALLPDDQKSSLIFYAPTEWGWDYIFNLYNPMRHSMWDVNSTTWRERVYDMWWYRRLTIDRPAVAVVIYPDELPTRASIPLRLHYRPVATTDSLYTIYVRSDKDPRTQLVVEDL